MTNLALPHCLQKNIRYTLHLHKSILIFNLNKTVKPFFVFEKILALFCSESCNLILFSHKISILIFQCKTKCKALFLTTNHCGEKLALFCKNRCIFILFCCKALLNFSSLKTMSSCAALCLCLSLSEWKTSL